MPVETASAVSRMRDAALVIEAVIKFELAAIESSINVSGVTLPIIFDTVRLLQPVATKDRRFNSILTLQPYSRNPSRKR